MTEISDRYERRAERFTSIVGSVPAGDARWEQPSPCEGWKAIDVLRHVVDTHQMFFGFVDHDAGPLPDHPIEAWPVVRDAMVDALRDPAVAGREYTGQMGTAVFESSVDRFIGADQLVHAWDLAKALGVDHEVPADEAAAVHESLAPLGDAMRQPGGFGPEVQVPDDAPPADRLLAFLGRDPGWGG